MKEIIAKALAVYLIILGAFTVIVFFASFSPLVDFIEGLIYAIKYSIYILIPIILIGGGLVLFAYSDEFDKKSQS